MGVDLERSLYALDSTTIDLCMSLFQWARFRRHKGAVKMHTLLDLRGNIPTFIRITDGKVHDVNIFDELLIEAGAFYVLDSGSIDFEQLYRFTLESALFVVRTKSNVLPSAATRIRSIPRPVCDQTKRLFSHLRSRLPSTPTRCVRSVTSMPKPAKDRFSRPTTSLCPPQL
jgi:hypothetical protein